MLTPPGGISPIWTNIGNGADVRGDPSDLFSSAATFWHDPGLVDWKTGDAQDFLTLNGSNVSQADDRINDHDAAQGTAARQPPIVTGLNSLRMFAPSDDGLLITTLSSTSNQYTYATILKAIALDSARFIMDSQTERMIVAVGNITGDEWGYFDGAWHNSGDTNDTNNHIIVFVLDGSGNTGEIYLDGVQILSTTMASRDISADVGLFADFVSNGSFLRMTHIGDQIFTDEAASTSDRQKIEGFIAHRYDQLALLPVGHPYKIDEWIL